MSFENVRNGAIQTIVNAGRWDASQISTCDFGIAELSGSAIILHPGPNSTIQPITFGTTMGNERYRAKQVTWSITGIVLIKDQGDPRLLLSRLWQAVDDIFASFNDDTLNGTAEMGMLTRIDRPALDAFITNGNVDFGFLTFALDAVESYENTDTGNE